MAFFIAKSVTQMETWRQHLEEHRAGAFVTFEGRVRTSNHGRDVSFLEYEAFEALAKAQFEEIEIFVKERFGAYFCVAVHRVGRLAVGECAVWLSVSAKHRKEAFLACEYAMNTLKHTLPIWKKEIFADGSHLWGNHGCACEPSIHPQPSYDVLFRPQRVVLKQSGQDKLKKARVLVIGAGGLGCPVATYLAGSGIGHLTICDGDQVEESNLARQIAYTFHEIGKPKASVLKQFLQDRFPMLAIEALNEHMTKTNAQRLLPHFDVVVDCTDCMPTKLLLNEFALKEQIPWITASVYQFYGEVSGFIPKMGQGCFACFRQEQTIVSEACSEAGILSITCGALGMLQARVVVSYLLGESHLMHKLHLLDANGYEMRKIEIKPDPKCLFCGPEASAIVQKCCFSYEEASVMKRALTSIK